MSSSTTTNKNRTGRATTPAKKKNISKHVLAAAQRQSEKDAVAVADGESDDEAATDSKATASKTKAKKPKGKKNKHTKPTSEVNNYLVLWKVHQTNPSGSGWKFNKNTQSWLLRHMYNDSQVNKSAFKNLLEYMGGMQGKSRGEKSEEAVEFTRMYKEWDSKEEKEEEEGEEENTVQFDGNNFEALSAHQKRKVYKRARQVYDVLKE